MGTSNVKSVNQGKLEVVKQEMTRVIINILGISELKWTGMGKFNSDDHYIYFCGQESCGRNGVALTVKKSPKYNTWVQSQKQQNYLCSFQGKSFSITVIQLYAPTNNAEEAELEQFYEDLQNIIELTPKRFPFHYRGLECKRRKSRDIWSKRKIWPWSTKQSRSNANRVLPRKFTCSKHPLPTIQEKTLHMGVTRWSIPKSD